MKYLLVDAANTFFRGRHVAHRGSDMWEKLGLSIHITMGAVNKCHRMHKADHVVFALEGRSWRKDFYAPYKAQRRAQRMAKTELEQDEDRLFFEAFDDLCDFLKDKSNCTVLQNSIAEADDMIARFIALHPNDEHVIISSDSDFYQLLAHNVTQYNGITDEHITLDGYVDSKGNPVKDKKTGEQKHPGDPQYLLFEKCMRGDTSDNIFSAFPGVRKKGTKNKVGLLEAYADRSNKGFNWNNMMLQRWTDHNGEEHRVLDDYERNRQLIDLTAQPEEIKQHIDETIEQASTIKANPMVGAKFLKFCGKYDLQKMSEQASAFAEWLQAPYKEHN